MVLALGIVYLMLPKIPGILKLVGFVERDFISSTSEFIYESTQTHPELQLRIGKRSDPQAYQVAIVKDGKSILFSGVLRAQATVENTTPTSKEIIPTDVTASVEASLSATVQEDAKGDSTATDSATRIEGASPSAQPSPTETPIQIEEIPTQKQEVEQSFLEAYEKIILKNDGYPTITYHWEGAQIIEEWQLSQEVDHFDFQITSNGLESIGNDNRTLIMIESTPIVELTAQVHDAKGSVAPVVQTVTPDLLSISIDQDWLQSTDRTLPITMARSYHPLMTQTITPRELLTTVVSEDIVSTALEIPTQTTLMTQFNQKILFWKADNHTIYSIENGRAAAIFTIFDQPIALSCTAQDCSFVTQTGRYLFTPPLDPSGNPTLINQEDIIQLSEQPIGGYASTNQEIYITSDTNPSGYLIKKTGDTVSTLLQNTNYAKEVSVSPDGTTVAVWANGQLQISQNGNDFQPINLTAQPIAFSAGNDGAVYAIVPAGDDVSTILRVTPTHSQEIPNLRAKFTAILWTEQTLSIAYTQSPLVGYLLGLPTHQINWRDL